MNRTLWSIALLVAAGVLGTGEPSAAQTAAAGPYYATPSWSQKLACDTPKTCPRFVVLTNWSNEAVLDRETGLVWQRTPPTLLAAQVFHDAVTCAGSVTGGRYGWRLPRKAELMSLGDPTNASAEVHLPAGHPFLIDVNDGTIFWTDERAAGVERASAVEFRASLLQGGYAPGLALLQALPQAPYRAWCVRSPQ